MCEGSDTVKAKQVNKVHKVSEEGIYLVCFIQQAVTRLSLLLAHVAVLTLDCVHK